MYFLGWGPRVVSAGIAQTMSFLGWKRSDQEFSRLGAFKPCFFLGWERPGIFSAKSPQTRSFLCWKRSNYEFSSLGAFKPRVFSGGGAETMYFLDWER